jgi:cellulose synthase/poly-beta-1,6-N-acetylglucosamine synthase-like glycosyltransferase
VIADGLSLDRTRQVIQDFQQGHPDLKVIVVDNPQRIIPAGLNQAIAAASGQYIVRLDAHSIPAADYVERCIIALEAGLGENVGGQWEILAGSGGWQGRGIAAAAAHPLGVGDARYRLGGNAQVVDTVPFGAFRRSLVDQVGWFDESLQTNEDYEFNVRVHQSGGRVWFDPGIRSAYIARKELGELARQYWRYGFWKARMLRRYPATFRFRQMAGAFVLSFPVLALLSIWLPWAGWLLILEIALYLLALLAAGIQVAVQQRDLAMIAAVPLAIATMHFSWGIAFVWSFVKR